MPKTHNYTKKAVHGAAIVVAMSVLASILGYILRIVLAKNLSPSDFGMVYAVIAMFGSIYVFQHLGLNDALTYCVSKHNTKGTHNHIWSSLHFVMRTQKTIAIILAISLAMLADLLAVHYLNSAAARPLIYMHCILLILLPYETAFQSLFQGLQMMASYSGVNLLRISVSLISTIIFLRLGFGASSLFMAYLVCASLPFIIWTPAFARMRPELWNSYLRAPSTYSPKVRSEMMAYSLPVLASSVAAAVMSYTDTLILTGTRTLAEVGLYNAAVPTASLLWAVASSLAIVTFPMTSELYHSKKLDTLRIGIETLQKYSMMIILPMAVTIFAYPEFILGILFGPSYVGAATTLQALALAAVIYSLAKVNDSIAMGIGKTKICFKAAMTSAAVNLILNILLIPRYGMIGAAIAVLCGFITSYAISTYLLRRIVRYKIPLLIWAKTAISVLIFYGSIKAIQTTLKADDYTIAAISLICGTLAYILMLFMLRVIHITEIKDLAARIIR